MWIKSVALVYDEEVWIPETKIDLSNEALSKTYLNNAWVKGSYDSTEGAIVADLAQAAAMFYRGPAGMENLYVGEANTLEITYQIRGEMTNQPLIVLLYGASSKDSGDWTQGLEAWKDVQRSMVSGQWATLSVDISAFPYDFLSVVKLQAGNGNTAGEMYIKSIEVKKVEYTITFENEGETYATAKAEPNKTVSAPAENPTKAATPNAVYVFDGWYNGETKFDFATPITADLTLTAKYTSFVPTTKIDLSNESVANTYLNNAWVKGSYDSTEGAIVADLAQGPAMFYRGPAGMDNLYIGESLYLDITYKTSANNPIIVSVSGGNSLRDSEWTSQYIYKDHWTNINTDGTWQTLSLDLSSSEYGFISVVKLQSGGTAGEMWIKSIAVRQSICTVTYLNEDGSTFTTQEVQADTATTAPETNPTKEGTFNMEYVFDGWYNGETKFDFSTPISANLTLTAKFTAREITLTKLNTAVTDIITATLGEANFIMFQLSDNDYAGLDTASADVSSLLGYIDIGGTVLNSLPSEPYFNLWGNANTLAFRAPGHTGETLGQVEYVTIKAGAYFPSATQSKTYYVTTEDITFVQISPDNWQVKKANYTVTYLNEDGSTFTTQEVEPDTATTAPATNPTKAGTLDVEYVFDGWYNGETKFDFSTLITADLTLTAKFVEQATAFEELETTVTGIHFGHNATFLSFTLSALDSAGTQQLDASILTKTNLLDKIEINGMSFKDFETRMDLNPHFDVYGAKDFSLRMRAVDSLDDFNRIVVRKGAQFPSLAYVNGTAKTCYTVSEDVEFIVYHDGTIINVNDLAESCITVTDVAYRLAADTENFLIFNIDGSDYPAFSNTAVNVEGITYAELAAIKFFDNITLKGTIYLGAETVSEATFAQILAANNGAGSVQPLLNHYYTPNYGYTYSFAIRVPHSGTMSEITSVAIAANTQFPSYQKFIANNTDYDYRLINTVATTFMFDAESGKFVEASELETLDLWMEKGASVRVAKSATYDGEGNITGYETSGIRFTTHVSKAQIDALNQGIENGVYKSVAYGTLIVPTDYLFGGDFTHAWLEANCAYLDIVSTGWIYEGAEYSSYYGSIVNLNETNLARKFSGIGYIQITYADDSVKYFYAPYLTSYARTAEYVAKAAIADRSATKTDEYTELVEGDGNYSPYTLDQRNFLTVYLVNAPESAISAEELAAINAAIGNLDAGETKTVTLDDDSEPLSGAYIQFDYSLNVDMIATLKYSNKDKSIIVDEDVYLFHKDSTYKQFLDVFRSNGAGYGISPTAVYLHSISFKNVGTQGTTAADQITTVAAQDRRIYDTELQQYLTRYLADGSDITVGAHLGLGGALTYLAKSGLAEYSKDESKDWLGRKYGRIEIGTDSANANTVYRTGADSLPKTLGGNGVNLINNYDVGRQIQQAYYADVAESEYTKAQYGPAGNKKDWPYNPVQAGDQYNNTSQIIDYEINTTDYYLYVKCRPLDWAQNNVTTKSYMENWYRLNADGTLRVDNNFIEWTGYNDLGGYHSNELPAVYFAQPMNYYVSNLSTDKNAAWTGDLTFNNKVGTWSDPSLSDYAPVHQGNGANTTLPYGNHENWFAWATGGTMDSIGVGVYIPNTAMFTSGRSATTTAFGESGQSTTKMIYQLNKNANVLSSSYCNQLFKKDLLSNMDEVDYEYMSCYVQNTSYTAPSIAFKMENYVPLAYSYVVAVDTISNMRNTFQALEQAGSLKNEGLDAWDRNDK